MNSVSLKHVNKGFQWVKEGTLQSTGYEGSDQEVRHSEAAVVDTRQKLPQRLHLCSMHRFTYECRMQNSVQFSWEQPQR